ncbi:hypothetical protein [Rhizobium sp. AG207R]|uniref:hypothetical protein n=1 Tax=Rhizobium sp. AG207R TaxID=2802287 RepID=UPI0022AC1F44|nr:hypothetical protein [Rhizobium sp. AG207R]MCZ3377477.1 hypothetical protein [Rhizobium sp. AG207R]
MTPTPEMIEAFWSKVEVQRTGAIHGLEDGLAAALALLPGEPVAWEYEVANYMGGRDGAFIGWDKRLSAKKPSDAQGIRNLRPLYASPAPLPVESKEVSSRWRIFEDTIHGYWGIELEQAGNDDDAILRPIKVHRDTVARIADAHNAALIPAPLPVAVKADTYALAVEVVDAVLGYSIENSGDPDRQRALYQLVGERIRSALSSPVLPQCCMCGKKGLSTVEGDGGSECELSDGRWVCSAECWDKAVEPTPASDIAALKEIPRHKTELLGYGNVYRMEGGSFELGDADVDNLEDVYPWAKEFEEHVGIAEIRLLPDTAGKSGADVRSALQHVAKGERG